MNSILISSVPPQRPPLPQVSQPSQAPVVKLPLDTMSRWFFVGKTGSGKTYLAKTFLRLYAKRGWKVVIVDPGHSWMLDDQKHTFGEFAHRGRGTVNSPRLVARFMKRWDVQCYQPSIHPMKDPGLMKLCVDVMRQGKVLIYFDETMAVMSPQFVPDEVLALWTRGRKKQVAAWGGSQRPSRIPEIIMSQAENWAIFRTLNPKDLDKMADWTATPAIAERALPERYWWYWNDKADNARLMRPI